MIQSNASLSWPIHNDRASHVLDSNVRVVLRWISDNKFKPRRITFDQIQIKCGSHDADLRRAERPSFYLRI